MNVREANMEQRIPAEAFPPGEYLKDELDARGWSQAEFAEIIGRDPKSICNLVSGKAQLTTDTALLLENALGLDAQYWLNLETTYRLAKSRERSIPDNVQKRAYLHERFPIRQMCKRGWIQPSDNTDIVQHQIERFFDLSSIRDEPLFMHAAKKKAETKKTSLQNAWLFRTRELARAMHVARFNAKAFGDVFSELAKLLPNPEEVRHVPRILSDAGIRFVIVEPIQGSKIDGACYWIDGSPVVAMSLTRDFHDSFWFNLYHELRHVAHGHGKEREVLDVDIFDIDSGVTEEERIVNEEAEDLLVSRTAFDDFVVRVSPMFSQQVISGFARRMNVHPGIVVGRLHYKKLLDWRFHAKMHVKVRHLILPTAVCDGWGATPGI